MKNAFYAQSGGVTSVINCSAYGLISKFKKDFSTANIYASKNGIVGLLEDELYDLSKTKKPLENLLEMPGGAFGSCRFKLPDLDDEKFSSKKQDLQNAFSYMGLKEKQNVNSIKLDKIFIGSCTNSRIEDLRIVADIVKNKKIAKNIKSAIIVPGSGLVKEKAENEGLDKIFTKSGFEWRSPGCSMCLGMNDDKLNEYERCASTSNRNFEGRQGRLGRTHLVSPATAAAAAIHGHFVDVRDI